MNEMMTYLQTIELTEDKRQQGKVKHRLSEIVMLVLFGLMANAEYWEEIEELAHYHERTLRLYLPLENGIPSHDTIQRVMGILSPDTLSELLVYWQKLLNQGEGEKLSKLLAIDGKTVRGSRSKTQKPAHIVTAFSVDDKLSIGQVKVNEKSNEITAVPQLLNMLNIEGYTVTADAMSTQVNIVKQIRSKKADYVLAVKENQPTLYEDIVSYFDAAEIFKSLETDFHHFQTIEKAHGQIEQRDYYQTRDVNWLKLNHKDRWRDLTSIGMVQNTIEKSDGSVSIERRYFISSLGVNVENFARAVRKHWMIESMHWELDVVFGEDANQTLDQIAVQNLNILRKLCLSILKYLQFDRPKSLRRKRFALQLMLPEYMEKLFSL